MLGGPTTPIGVYDHPPPADAGEGIRAVRVADIGVIPLLEGTTRLRDFIQRRAGAVLGAL